MNAFCIFTANRKPENPSQKQIKMKQKKRWVNSEHFHPETPSCFADLNRTICMTVSFLTRQYLM